MAQRQHQNMHHSISFRRIGPSELSMLHAEHGLSPAVVPDFLNGFFLQKDLLPLADHLLRCTTVEMTQPVSASVQKLHRRHVELRARSLPACDLVVTAGSPIPAFQDTCSMQKPPQQRQLASCHQHPARLLPHVTFFNPARQQLGTD
jgi:hypothetical protein